MLLSIGQGHGPSGFLLHPFTGYLTTSQWEYSILIVAVSYGCGRTVAS